MATSRVFRALSEVQVPVGVRELALWRSARVVSKLLVTLAAEGIVDRGAGRDEWATSFVVAALGAGQRVRDDQPWRGVWLAPRGLEQVTDRLAE